MTKSKPKVHVYYGPSSRVIEEFSIPLASEYISLTSYVSLTEPSIFRKPVDTVELPSNQLVAFPEEYFGVTENFINSFWSRLDVIPMDVVYLINPPLQIVKQAKIHGLEVNQISHEYKKIDKSKILAIGSALELKLFGQEMAKGKVLRNLIPLTNKTAVKPVVLMFYGPSGVGKTETAKIIASELGGDPFRSQFSMMQTSSLSEYLYGNKTSDKSLSSDLLERETNVLVFDEFDKTTSHFHSAFYQLFDEGIFQDKNYRVKLGGSIIICTSNYNSQDEIRQHIGNALYSRITSFVKFNNLRDENKLKIASGFIGLYVERINKEFSGSIPSKNELLNSCKAMVLACHNAREIESLIQYFISDIIYQSFANNAPSES